MLMLSYVTMMVAKLSKANQLSGYLAKYPRPGGSSSVKKSAPTVLLCGASRYPVYCPGLCVCPVRQQFKGYLGAWHTMHNSIEQ